MNTPSRTSRPSRTSENSDPNILNITSSSKKTIKSPSPAKPSPASGKTIIHRPRAPSPPKERKFIVIAKKKKNKDPEAINSRQRAYEALRASQEEFFRKCPSNPEVEKVEEETQGLVGENGSSELGFQDLEGSSRLRKMRNMVMDEALSSIPEQGSGRVKHLVEAFEKLLLLSNGEDGGNGRRRVMRWALPGLQQRFINGGHGDHQDSPRSTSSPEFFPPERSMENNIERWSLGSRESREGGGGGGGRRSSRRHSSDSSRRSWNKKLRVTSLQPFKLRTEQRGRLKEEQLIQKVKEMLMEAEKKRIPIAQGLPWTTDEPQCLVKPPVKEPTEPLDILLHSDVRAVERAEYDHYVAERISFAEELKMERDRQRKLEEEDELRRMRRELVPRAQPMPFFDRPFFPKKSTRPRTVPKEPRFNVRPHLKTCVSAMMGRG